ncbi:MAG: hypothetical protein HXL48_07475, partial [Solobacterium sp.]|nr:hypothetical protein [Solobacterium sp.]
MSKIKILFFCIGAIFTTMCCFNRVYADESSDNTETTEQLSNNEENALYVDGKLANGWIVQESTSGVEISYFYKNGFKLTGIGVDENGERLFIEGLLAEGLQEYSGAIRYYKDGRGYTGFADGKFYYQGNAANGWVHHEQPVDGLYYCFYKDGLPLTGLGTDADGEHLFIKGSVAQGYQTYEGVRRMYVDGKPANGWMHHVPPVDGLYYCFYKDGLPLTGLGTDGDGEHLFINGSLAQGLYSYGGVEKYYKDGRGYTGFADGKYYYQGNAANGWVHHEQPVDGLYYCFY